MTDSNQPVPIPVFEKQERGMPTLEDLELYLSVGRDEFKIYSGDEVKRAAFRLAWERPNAIDSRRKALRSHDKAYGEKASLFAALAKIAALTNEKRMEKGLRGTPFAKSASDIKEAREQLGGEVAQMIAGGQFKELLGIIRKLGERESVASKARGARAIDALYDFVWELDRLPTDTELREAVSRVCGEQDPSNFGKELQQIGLAELPRYKA